MRLAIIMAVAMLCNFLGHEVCMPFAVRCSEGQRIMGGGQRKRCKGKSGGGGHCGQLQTTPANCGP